MKRSFLISILGLMCFFAMMHLVSWFNSDASWFDRPESIGEIAVAAVLAVLVGSWLFSGLERTFRE